MSNVNEEREESLQETGEITELGKKQEHGENQQTNDARGKTSTQFGDGQGGETQPVSSKDIGGVNVETSRRRTLSQKALQNAIQAKVSELEKEGKTLRTNSEIVYCTLQPGVSTKDLGTQMLNLKKSYAKYEELLEELNNLSKQDKWGELYNWTHEQDGYSTEILEYACKAINEGSNRQRRTSATPSLSSRRTRRTNSSCSSSSSAKEKRRALAEAAAARKKAEFDRIMAEKETERKWQEAEEELRRKQSRAQYDRDMAMLAAEKAEAMANAKLQAIEQAIHEEEDLLFLAEQKDLEDKESRTKEWVNTQDEPAHIPEVPNESSIPVTVNPQTYLFIYLFYLFI